MADSPYLPRLLDPVLASMLVDVAAVLLTGPRATGKTTTAGRLARSVLRLDRPETAAAAMADPDAVLRGTPRPLLVDEWQVVPEILGALKRSVDHDDTPGQFIVTGSARSQLAAELWPGTGRLVRVSMFGLTTRERIGNHAGRGVLAAVAGGGVHSIQANGSPKFDLRDYVREILVSGFPQPAVRLPEHRRALWLSSYVEQVVTRDAAAADRPRDPMRLRRFVDALAANTAGVIDDTALLRASGINRRTALAYESLLSGLSVADSIPPWWSNRIKRLAQRPKRFLIDAALAAAVLRIDEEGILRDGDMLGRLLETFVVSQLRAEIAARHQDARLHHLRTEEGRHEIDVVVEFPGQRILGIEIKATSAPGREHARHLSWLRDQLGDSFVGGIVFHTGSRVFDLEDRISAAPIAALWEDQL